MTTSACAGVLPVGCPARPRLALEIGPGLRNLIERLIRSYRTQRAGREFERLDGRILKDIGFTRLGVRKAALTNRNELNAWSGT